MLERKKLIAASDHIAYEIWMLRLTAHLLTDLPTGSPPGQITYKPVTHTHFSEDPQYSSNAPITPPSKDEHKTVLGNSLLESFGVHFRALLDFFYLDHSNDDDILAVQFFDSPDDWKEVRPNLTKMKIKSMKTRVNKEIAHLTYKRLSVSSISEEWPILEFKSHIMSARDAFDSHVDHSLLSERWDTLSG
jgi:hypothetical protein